MEYLALLTGTPAPDRLEQWNHASIGEIVAYIDGQPYATESAFDRQIGETVRGFGVPLSAEELETTGILATSPMQGACQRIRESAEAI